MSGRARAFITVGAAGFVWQIAVVAALTFAFGLRAGVATVIGVEVAVLHNFFWHERWTWRDRAGNGGGRWRRLLRFHLTTGVTSITGNVLVVLLAGHLLGAGAVIANGLAVATMSLVNYLVADRFVFPPIASQSFVGLRRKNPLRPDAALQTILVVVACAITALPARAAEITPQTLAAWSEYVAAAEAGLAAKRQEGRPEPTGRETRIPGGLIHEWHGTVVIPGITVTQLVDALTNPGTPPPQEDVIESRVIARNGDRLRVYLKVVRTAIITVTYDTEHDVSFVRHDSRHATSRSVATTITEAGGDDHGFLWKLNSYWQYRQTDAGVQVDMMSLSLSRGVPAVLRPIAGPIVNRIARESMIRTLEAVRRFGAGLSASNSPQSSQRPRSSS